MADITPALPAGRQIINGYGDGGFRIAGEVHRGSLLVFPERTVTWSVTTVNDLTVESFDDVMSAAEVTDVLLVGTGETMSPLTPTLRNALRERGIVVDAMATGAACRTFNVLLSEDRRVAAALIAVG